MFLHDKTSKKHLVEKYNKLRKQYGTIPSIMEAVSNGVTVDISPIQNPKKAYNKPSKPCPLLLYLIYFAFFYPSYFFSACS